MWAAKMGEWQNFLLFHNIKKTIYIIYTEEQRWRAYSFDHLSQETKTLNISIQRDLTLNFGYGYQVTFLDITYAATLLTHKHLFSNIHTIHHCGTSTYSHAGTMEDIKQKQDI